MKRLLVVSVLFFCYQLAWCQAWRDQFVQAQQLYNQDQWEEARNLAENCLQNYLSEAGAVDGNYAAIMRLLVTTHFSLDEYEKAAEYGEKEKSARRKISEENTENFATTQFNLGNAYLLLGEYDKAVAELASSTQLYTSLLGRKQQATIVSEWKWATALLYSGSNDTAFEHFQGAFAQFDESAGIDFDYVQAAYDYSTLLAQRKMWKEAAPYLEQLQYIYEDNGLTGEVAYAEILQMRTNAAMVEGDSRSADLFDQTQKAIDSLYEGTEKTAILNEWAVELQNLGFSEQAEVLLGTTGETENNALVLNNRASIAFNQGKYLEAGDYYYEALKLLNDQREEEAVQWADIASNLSILLRTLGKTTEASEFQEKVVKIYRSKLGVENEKTAISESGWALLLVSQEELDEAETLYLNADIHLRKGTAEYVRNLSGLANLFQRRGDYQKADSLYTLTLQKAARFEKVYAEVLNNYGSFEEENGNFLSAEKWLSQALDVEKTLYGINSLQYAATCDNLATLYLELGNYAEAKQKIDQSLKIKKDRVGDNNAVFAYGLLTRGRILLATGQYAEAEPDFRKAMDIIRSSLGEQNPAFGEALNSLAIFYQTLGNFGEAEPLLEKSIRIFETNFGKNHVQYATSLENLATLYQLTGEGDKALPLLEEALEVDRKLLGEQHPLYSTTLHNLASLYKEQGSLGEAEDLFLQALDIDRRTFGEEHPGYARTMYNLAGLYQDMEEYEKAEGYYQQVAQLRKKILGENHPDYAFSLYGLASISRVLQKPEALTYYQEAINKYLFQIQEYFPSLSEKEKSAFYEKIKPVFDSFKDYAIEEALKGNKEVLETLYDLQLSTKALLLNASSKVRERILDSNDTELIERFNEWLERKEKLVKYYTFSVEELEEANIDLAVLNEEANLLEKEISLNSDIFKREIDRQTHSWKEVAASLQDSDLAMEIFRIERTFETDSIYYIALAIEKSSSLPELIVFEKGNQLENRYFKYYKNAIKYSVGDTISYSSFWKPIEDIIAGHDRIFVSADGIFNKLSLNTLYDKVTGKHVIDEYEIRYVSNTVELIDKSSSATVTKEAFVLGNPAFGHSSSSEAGTTRATLYGFSKQGVPDLPGTGKEVDLLRQNLSEQSWKFELLTQNQASESNFKKLRKPRLLHIATHGFFMPDLKLELSSKAFGIHIQNEQANPLFRSGILLAGVNNTLAGKGSSDGEDGILSAYEAMNLNLDGTELVVLSACETGLGEVKNGEGVYGLQRSFIVAGAESLIMSLWKVNDETTQQLMELFYQKWLSGEDKYRSFISAQKELKEKYPDPYHWGAFVILGQ